MDQWDKHFAEGESWKTGSSIKKNNMDLYLDWLLTPQPEREPESKNKFAQSIGVTFQTLKNYEKEPEFQKKFEDRSRGLFKATRLQDVIDNMFDIATSPEHKNAVTAARLLLDWSGRSNNEGKASSIEDISLEELIERVNALVEKEGILDER